jgi:3-hydroxyisobutyrate dehydrogenase-like beta-hydroxyacid dehydrogenase
MSKTIAFLGLGAMGARMARRLIDAGHDVVVWNRTAERAAPLAEAGARVAGSPREAAADRDIVISVVRDDGASEAVWLDPDRGALEGMRPGAVAVESSTLTPGWTRTLAEKMSARQIQFVDAPVAGSRPQAEAGALIYLVGGEESTLESVREVLLVMGGAVHHCGPTGAGATIKLAVNALFGIQVAALSELLGMTRKSGIDDARALEVLGATPVTSPAAKGVGGLMVARKFAPMFPIDLVEKDFGYVEAAAAEAGAEVPTAHAVRGIYERAKEAGLAGENISAVVKLFE